MMISRWRADITRSVSTRQCKLLQIEHALEFTGAAARKRTRERLECISGMSIMIALACAGLYPATSL